MARQLKKILKRSQPKEKPPEVKQEKPGKDYLLVVILSLTVIFLLIGWSTFTNLNRALYVALIVSLSTTYARRHFKLTETQGLWVERTGYISMACAIVLFVGVIYYQFAG